MCIDSNTLEFLSGELWPFSEIFIFLELEGIALELPWKSWGIFLDFVREVQYTP